MTSPSMSGGSDLIGSFQREYQSLAEEVGKVDRQNIRDINNLDKKVIDLHTRIAISSAQSRDPELSTLLGKINYLRGTIKHLALNAPTFSDRRAGAQVESKRSAAAAAAPVTPAPKASAEIPNSLREERNAIFNLLVDAFDNINKPNPEISQQLFTRFDKLHADTMKKLGKSAGENYLKDLRNALNEYRDLIKDKAAPAAAPKAAAPAITDPWDRIVSERRRLINPSPETLEQFAQYQKDIKKLRSDIEAYIVKEKDESTRKILEGWLKELPEIADEGPITTESLKAERDAIFKLLDEAYTDMNKTVKETRFSGTKSYEINKLYEILHSRVKKYFENDKERFLKFIRPINATIKEFNEIYKDRDLDQTMKKFKKNVQDLKDTWNKMIGRTAEKAASSSKRVTGKIESDAKSILEKIQDMKNVYQKIKHPLITNLIADLDRLQKEVENEVKQYKEAIGKESQDRKIAQEQSDAKLQLQEKQKIIQGLRSRFEQCQIDFSMVDSNTDLKKLNELMTDINKLKGEIDVRKELLGNNDLVTLGMPVLQTMFDELGARRLAGGKMEEEGKELQDASSFSQAGYDLEYEGPSAEYSRRLEEEAELKAASARFRSDSDDEEDLTEVGEFRKNNFVRLYEKLLKIDWKTLTDAEAESLKKELNRFVDRLKPFVNKKDSYERVDRDNVEFMEYTARNNLSLLGTYKADREAEEKRNILEKDQKKK